MLASHFYNATLRRIVTVFGTLFNHLQVVREDKEGNVVSITRVPLAYGPKMKFLARLDEQPKPDGPKIAIKLPRMSFEITSLTYDVTSKIGSFTQFSAPDSTDPSKKRQVRSGAPYRIGMQLSIMAKNLDDANQILEQILPYFQPEYTVAIKDVDGINTSNDVPIVLNGVSLVDDYEGDFMSRRAIVYTLDFELRVRFYGAIDRKKIIKDARVSVAIDNPENNVEEIRAVVDPIEAGPEDSHSILESITFLENTDTFILYFGASATDYTVGETITGDTSGTNATVRSINGDEITVTSADGVFIPGEEITGASSDTIRELLTSKPIFG